MGDIAQSEVEVIITVAEDRKANLKQIASELRNRGLKISGEPLESLGMISGKAAANTLDALSKVNGVASVESAGSVQLPPPESDIQ
jgi:hypothetical protein